MPEFPASFLQYKVFMKTSEVSKKQSVSEKFVDQLYSMDFQAEDEKGNIMDVSDSGFLGLLATGYKGLVMLRKKRGTTHLYAKFTKGKKPIQRKKRAKN
jgi:hypothetical protein